MSELKLWSVEVATPRAGKHPRNPSYWSKHQSVNVAAEDIIQAIGGALDELVERYEGELDRNDCWVLSASHRGRVNRIVRPHDEQ